MGQDGSWYGLDGDGWVDVDGTVSFYVRNEKVLRKDSNNQKSIQKGLFTLLKVMITVRIQGDV